MRVLSHRTLSILLFCFIATLTACSSSSSSLSSVIKNTNIAYAALNLHYDADRYEFTTPASMCSAIMTAEVQNITHGSAHWNTPDGLRPHVTAAANTTIAQTIMQRGYRIYDTVKFSTITIFKDSRHHTTQEFVTVGGQVAQDSYWLDPYPQLKDGNHYLVVFGPGSQPEGKGKTEQWLVVYDAFPVDAHGIVTLQQAGSASEPGSGKPQSAVTVPLTSLKSQLAKCK